MVTDEQIEAKARKLCVAEGCDPDHIIWTPEDIENERLECERLNLPFDVEDYKSFPLWRNFTAQAERILDPQPPYCNFCGDSCWDSANMNVEAVEVSVFWGYGSDMDDQKHEFKICEKCYTEKLRPMMVNEPDITSYI